MNKKIPGSLHAVFALSILITTTLIGSLPILIVGLLKLVPNQRLNRYCSKSVDQIATLWTDANRFYLDKIHPAHWDVTGLEHLNQRDWYLVVANHQSWLDIVVLQRIFNRKIPVLKFFIKDQLKWIPFLGFSWWAMGCPFMKRYSATYLAKHPHKKGKDLQATQKALKSFKQTPGTLMSFVEGTRFTKEKKSQQNSPYQHLLNPKAGGIGFVIQAMNQEITEILDVTIVYPDPKNSLWDFLCRRFNSIKVHVRKIPIPAPFLNSALLEDENAQTAFRQWLNEQWFEKDKLMSTMANQGV